MVVNRKQTAKQPRRHTDKAYAVHIANQILVVQAAPLDWRQASTKLGTSTWQSSSTCGTRSADSGLPVGLAEAAPAVPGAQARGLRRAPRARRRARVSARVSARAALDEPALGRRRSPSTRRGGEEWEVRRCGVPYQGDRPLTKGLIRSALVIRVCKGCEAELTASRGRQRVSQRRRGMAASPPCPPCAQPWHGAPWDLAPWCWGIGSQESCTDGSASPRAARRRPTLCSRRSTRCAPSGCSRGTRTSSPRAPRRSWPSRPRSAHTRTRRSTPPARGPATRPCSARSASLPRHPPPPHPSPPSRAPPPPPPPRPPPRPPAPLPAVSRRSVGSSLGGPSYRSRRTRRARPRAGRRRPPSRGWTRPCAGRT